jgi:adenylate kinase
MRASGGGSLRLVVFGAPGVGKGTQAAEIQRLAGVPHVSTGDMLRCAMREGTPLGMKIREIVERGDLVSDDLMSDVVEERLGGEDASDGFILDGYPRTVAQADYLDRLLAARGQALDRVINIEVPEQEIIERLSGRRVCVGCGATFNLKQNRPVVDGVCDVCGGTLSQRSDDTRDAIAERLKVYREQTAPVTAHYQEQGLLTKVNGCGKPDEVLARIRATLPTGRG